MTKTTLLLKSKVVRAGNPAWSFDATTSWWKNEVRWEVRNIWRCFGTVVSPASSHRGVQWACSSVWEHPPLATANNAPQQCLAGNHRQWTRKCTVECCKCMEFTRCSLLSVTLVGGNIFPPHPQLITLKSGISNNIKQTLQMAGHCRFLSSLM